MTQLIIDTDDRPEVLRAARNMISELLGEGPPEALTIPKKVDIDAETHTHKDDSSGGKTGAQTEHKPAAATTGEPDLARTDTKGVNFNPEYCGEAAKPFYGSSKRLGQWKKRQGVADAVYDAWYAEQLAALTTTAEVEEEIDTATAFGNNDTVTDTTTAEEILQAETEDIPTDAGALMGWASEHQVAGRLNPNWLGEAYVKLGITVVDLFPPNSPEDIKERTFNVYQLVSARVQQAAG